jgi:hypothetical protein
MQDYRPPAVTNWIKAEKQRDPELAKLLEAPITQLFLGQTSVAVHVNPVKRRRKGHGS